MTMLLIMLVSTFSAACSEPPARHTNGPGSVRIHPVEVRGGTFEEGFVAFEQHFDGDAAWTSLTPLGEGFVSLDRTTSVRVWVLPCEANCTGTGDAVRRFHAGRGLDPRRRARIDAQLIRCQGPAEVARGRLTDVTPIVENGTCRWTGSGGSTEWCEPSNVLSHTTTRPDPIAPADLQPGRFDFVEVHGCRSDSRFVEIDGEQWRGQLDDCNSSDGTWAHDSRGAHWYDKSSTTVACGGNIRLSESASIERIGERYLRFRDRDGFDIAIAERR